MAMPAADEFVRNWYNAFGAQITGPTLEALTTKFMPSLSVTLQDGTPQIKAPAGDVISKGCVDTVNASAVSSPGWAKAVGHEGLFKVMTACIAEQNGSAPAGFSQQVIAALDSPWWKKPIVWAAGLGLVATAALVLRKKKRR